MTRHPFPIELVPEPRRRLINTLGLLAVELEDEAELYRTAGGGWGLMLAGEVATSAGQLRLIATLMIRSPRRVATDTVELWTDDDTAELWIEAAINFLATIREANTRTGARHA